MAQRRGTRTVQRAEKSILLGDKRPSHGTTRTKPESQPPERARNFDQSGKISPFLGEYLLSNRSTSFYEAYEAK